MGHGTTVRHAAVLLAALVLVGGASGCSGSLMARDQAEDSEARADYYEQAAKTYYDGGRYDNAVRMWDKVLEERPQDQWAKFGAAKSLHMVGTVQSLRRAEIILEEILPLDWNHPTRGNVKFEVQTTLAGVYSSLADFYDRDVRLLEGRLANDPNADTNTLKTQIATQTRIRNELLMRSLPLWHEVLNQSQENPYALAGLAKANIVAGNEDAGIHYANRYIRLSRESQVGWRQQLAQWEKTSAGQVTRDQRAFFMSKIAGAREKEIGMHLLLASIYMRREQFTQAVSEYDEVIALDPALPAAYVERGQAYAALRLYPQAVRDLEQYLKMTDPERQRRARVNAAELLDRYRRLAGDTPLLGPSGSGRAPPAPAPAPAPAPRLSPSASGSPDG